MNEKKNQKPKLGSKINVKLANEIGQTFILYSGFNHHFGFNTSPSIQGICHGLLQLPSQINTRQTGSRKLGNNLPFTAK